MRRCPRCGGDDIFESWFTLKDSCPDCGWVFAREPGWYIGGVMINTGASILVFGTWLVGSMVAFWPDVPWTLVTVGGLALMAVFPIAFYPMSKTIWLAIDLIMFGMDPSVRE